MKQIEKVIYLAGGFRSEWQVKVHSKLDGVSILDPSKHGIQDPTEYTNWDLDAISKCSIVLAYMEPSNPGGYSLALEIGYAKALGKMIIFVDETGGTEKHRYFEMVRQCSTKIYKNLDSALKYIVEVALSDHVSEEQTSKQ